VFGSLSLGYIHWHLSLWHSGPERDTRKVNNVLISSVSLLSVSLCDTLLSAVVCTSGLIYASVIIRQCRYTVQVVTVDRLSKHLDGTTAMQIKRSMFSIYQTICLPTVLIQCRLQWLLTNTWAKIMRPYRSNSGLADCKQNSALQYDLWLSIGLVRLTKATFY